MAWKNLCNFYGVKKPPCGKMLCGKNHVEKARADIGERLYTTDGVQLERSLDDMD